LLSALRSLVPEALTVRTPTACMSFGSVMLPEALRVVETPLKLTMPPRFTREMLPPEEIEADWRAVEPVTIAVSSDSMSETA